MKTMRSIDGKRIFRTTDEKAAEMYHNGDANYATKEEWKKLSLSWRDFYWRRYIARSFEFVDKHF